MFQTRKLTHWILAAVLGTGALAQETEQPQIHEELVVTAHRTETNAREIGSSVTVIDAEQIARSGQTQVVELLRHVPGLDVVRSGATGQNTSLFMRGSGSAHTLVLLDGVALNDAISPGNACDLAHLSLDNVERIEIVRGPQSTLYGSDAMAGVINIISKKGKGPLAGNLNLEGGSNQTQRASVQAHGAQNNFDYSVAATHYKTDGVSAADLTEEKDGYQQEAFATQLGYQVNEALAFSLLARVTQSDADIDKGPGPYGDDPNFVSGFEERVFKIGADLAPKDSIWQSNLSISQQDMDREVLNAVDADSPESSQTATYDSRRWLFSLQNELQLSKQKLVFGLEHEKELGSSVYDSQGPWGPYYSEFAEENAKTGSLYLQDHLTLHERWALTLGARYDDHDQFGNKTTGRVATSVRIGPAETYAKASYGTGFKAPSLYQLYSPFGNFELDPEENEGWDVGVDHQFEALDLLLSVTRFHNDYENLIDFSGATFTYMNMGAVKTSGEEVGLTWKRSGWEANGHYTRTKAEDANGVQLERRPREKSSLGVSYLFPNWSRKTSLTVTARRIGARNQFDFVNFTGLIWVDSYTVADFAGSIALGKRLQLNARAENLFDKSYQEVYGYQTSGTTAYLGLNLIY